MRKLVVLRELRSAEGKKIPLSYRWLPDFCLGLFLADEDEGINDGQGQQFCTCEKHLNELSVLSWTEVSRFLTTHEKSSGPRKFWTRIWRWDFSPWLCLFQALSRGWSKKWARDERDLVKKKERAQKLAFYNFFFTRSRSSRARFFNRPHWPRAWNRLSPTLNLENIEIGYSTHTSRNAKAFKARESWKRSCRE